jgi:hypothetical protein
MHRIDLLEIETESGFLTSLSQLRGPVRTIDHKKADAEKTESSGLKEHARNIECSVRCSQFLETAKGNNARSFRIRGPLAWTSSNCVKTGTLPVKGMKWSLHTHFLVVNEKN